MPKRAKKTKLKKELQKFAKRYKKRKKIPFIREVAVAFGWIAIIVVLVQLIYPPERTLPFTRVADLGVGSLTKREAIDYLFSSYSSAPLTIDFGDTSMTTTIDKAGVLVDFQKAADAAARYPWWQRLIPFSLFYKSVVINAKPEVTLDTELAEQFVDKIKARCDRPVRDASVAINGSEAVLVKGTEGRVCNEIEIKRSLANTSFRHEKASAIVGVRTLYQKKTNQIATGQFERAKAIINSGLTIDVSNKKTTVPREVLASWVIFADNAQKQLYDVALNESAIQVYLQSLRGDVYVAPFPTDVHTLDGKEVSREVGRSGRDIDYAKAIEQIKQSLLNKKTTLVTTRVVNVQPPLNYLHNYSRSQLGLERLLADIVAEKGNYGITVTELGGMGRAASVNGNRSYVTASTFKLFVAYFVLKDLESGKLKWDDVITGGLNVRQCFEEMIVRSANRCAIAYISRYGGANIVGKMNELGFKSVKRDTTWWATPNDMALYLKKLERGELLQGESKDFLIGLLKRQVWRYGIPTGIRGVPIADKVGFLDDYIHDLAIIYTPRGTYILAIMTKGGSYGGMADVARRVESYLKQ